MDELDEAFTVTPRSPVNATIADSSGTGAILDDDISLYYIWLPLLTRP